MYSFQTSSVAEKTGCFECSQSLYNKSEISRYAWLYPPGRFGFHKIKYFVLLHRLAVQQTSLSAHDTFCDMTLAICSGVLLMKSRLSGVHVDANFPAVNLRENVFKTGTVRKKLLKASILP